MQEKGNGEYGFRHETTTQGGSPARSRAPPRPLASINGKRMCRILGRVGYVGIDDAANEGTKKAA